MINLADTPSFFLYKSLLRNKRVFIFLFQAAISGMVGIQKIIEEIRDSENRSAEEQNVLDGYYGRF